MYYYYYTELLNPFTCNFPNDGESGNATYKNKNKGTRLKYFSIKTMDNEYVDILTGENLIGQNVYPLNGKGMVYIWMGGIVILATCEYLIQVFLRFFLN